jgi:hypothetical protein
MTSISWLKTASTSLLVALLAACGGGGGSSTTPVPEVAWASPAVFVTPGAASKSFALAGCRKYTEIQSDNYNDEESWQRTESTVDLYTATMVIESNGDVSFKAATTVTGTVSELWRMTFTEARSMNWSVYGTTQTPSYTLNGYQNLRDGQKYVNVYGNSEEPSVEFDVDTYQSYSSGYTNTYVDFDCNMTDMLALQINADQARAAKNLGTAAGVNSYDDYYADGRIDGGKAYWENVIDEEYTLPQYAHMRFDLASGELASSATSGGTYTAVSLALPSSTSSFGLYGESIERAQSFYGYKDAKTICIASIPNVSSEEGFAVVVTAYGSKFMPNSDRRRMGLRETPQGGFGSDGCYSNNDD